jgi:hypothetical protein
VSAFREKLVNVIAVAQGQGNLGVNLTLQNTITDSVVWSTGPTSYALMTHGTDNVVRNVTAIATGAGSTGISVNGGPGCPSDPTLFLDGKSSIFRGAAMDVRASTSCPDGYADFSNSNFRGSKTSGPSFRDAGGNQLSVDPLFVNAAAGDFHEASGSPTIDAGATDAKSGSSDPDGRARTLGAAADIGAFELVPSGAGPATQPGTGGTTGSPAPTPILFKGVQIRTSKAALKHGRVKVKLKCPSLVPGSCVGRVDLKRGRRSVAHARFSIAAGKTETLTLKLHLKHRRPPKRLTARASAHDGAGESATTKRRIALN